MNDETRAAAFACYLLALRALGAIYAERTRMIDAVCSGRIPRGNVPVWYPAELKWRDATNRTALLCRLFLLLACDGR
jgi:hypothetical protein